MSEHDLSRRDFLKGFSALALAGTQAAAGAVAAELEKQAPPGALGPGPVPVTLDVNGKRLKLQLELRVTLLDALRNHADLTGCKEVCDRATCGACTVLVESLPVSACTYLAYETRGKSVTTIEGLEKADGTLHPIQQAFIDEFAFQCGYCTPGMIMAAKALLDENPRPTRDEIIHHMDGNICRCTGYLPIVNAINRAAATMAQESKK
mgnify:CR=1 FL=1